MAPYGALAKEWDTSEVGKFIATHTKVGQYRQTFEDNYINGKRLLKLKSTQLPQLGIQRFDHIKHLWNRIQRIQALAAEYEAMRNDPDKMLEYGAVRIQSLARGKLDRHRVDDIKNAREQKQQEMFEHTEQHRLQEEEEALRDLEATFGDDEVSAAVKIQQRARGMKERKEHAKLKAQGRLPGQQRAEAAAYALLTEEELKAREAAAVKLQARSKGMMDRAAVASKREAGTLPGQVHHKAGDAAPPGSPLPTAENTAGNASADEASPAGAQRAVPEGMEELGEEHSKAALKIQARARLRSDAAKMEQLKAQGLLPGQLRAKKIEEWGSAVFKQFANEKNVLTKKELTNVLKSLPRAAPKKVLPGTKYQSLEDMINAMDADGDGEIDEAEWVVNLKECPGLAAALAENVQAAGLSVTVDDIAAVGNAIKVEDFGAEHAAAALKIQARQRVKRDLAKVDKMKAEGLLPGQARAKMIEEWGTAVFRKFDANSDGKLSNKELAEALRTLPSKKPKKVLPGTKFQSVEDMIASMDADADGAVDEAEWLLNLKECPGLAAALAENVSAAGTSVSVQELADFTAEDFGEDHKAAALKIQARQRGARDRAAVAKAKAEGALPGQRKEAEAEAGGTGETAEAPEATAGGDAPPAAPAGDTTAEAAPTE